jgi:hypothetical protein
MLARIQYFGQTLGSPGPWMVSVLFLGLLLTNSHAISALAQSGANSPPVAANDKLDAPPLTKAKAPTQKTSIKPAWKDLSPAQQQALQPLAEHWNGLEEERRRKWLVISKNYSSLSAAEQVKMHSRMSEWVLLSQQQRNQARLNYAETKKLSAEEKAKKWQDYQALSPEEKKKFADKAAAKPIGVAAPKSASARKLANVPVSPVSPVPGSRLAAAKQPVQENTLLPQPEPAQADPAPALPNY